MEKTLAIIKPDGVARGLIGEVISRIEKEHLSILEMELTIFEKGKAKEFYIEHENKPFYNDLIEFMSSGPVVILVLEGLNAISRWRNIIGPTISSEAKSGTIRGDFGDTSIPRHNIVHGSDSLVTAKKEIEFYYRNFYNVQRYKENG